MKKPILILLVLALLGDISLISFHLTHRAASIRDGGKDAAMEHPAVGHDLSVRPPGTQGPARPSPPSWRPSAVFEQVGKPAPQQVFPRGENATRRYHEPASRDIAPRLSAARPTVLAKSPEDGRFNLLPEETDVHTRVARRMVFDPTALDQILADKTFRLLAPTPS